MDAVDPAPGQIRQGGQVRLLHQHLGLEAPHLAGGSCTLRHRATTDDPAHGGISAKPVGIVHVLVPGEPPEDRLAKLSNQRVAAILAGPGVGETLSGEVRQAEGIIEVPKGEQLSKGSSPASDVTFEPWNSSLRRWSKATRRAAPSASPAAPSISSPALAVYSFVQYTEIGLAPHPATCASGECGLKGALAATAISATVSPLALASAQQAQARGAMPTFNFKEVEAGIDQNHHVAE